MAQAIILTVLISSFICLIFSASIFIFNVISACVKKRATDKNVITVYAIYLIYILVFCNILRYCHSLISVQSDYEITSQEIEPPMRYAELLKAVPFQTITINKTETDWEIILNDGLFFSDFEKAFTPSISVCSLRNTYYANLSTPLHTSMPQASKEVLYQIINNYYGTSILPKTNLTIEDIESRALPLEQRMETPISDIKAETYIRAIKCYESQSPSGEMLYQTARSADDTVKILAENGGTLKEMLFFSYIATNFYLMCLPYERTQISDAFIYYRISKIYLHLYKYSGYAVTDKYSEHFLLSAEAYMHLAVDSWEITPANDVHNPESYITGNNIFDTMPEYAYDYACILDSFYSVYSCNNQETRTDCVKYATAHIEHFGPEGRYYADCKLFINKYKPEGNPLFEQ